MSLSFCVLGSGSAGNSTLIAADDDGARHFLLIDAGLSPRMTAQRLGALGLRLDHIRDILLTHLDGDHFHQGWLRASVHHRIRVHVHEAHRGAARAVGLGDRAISPFDGRVSVDGPLTIDAIRLPHDEHGTCGFVIEGSSGRLGYATDLGHAPAALFNAFVGLDALAIESNYDPAMQLASARPWFLKQRIMGGSGHLSNEESIEAVMRVARYSLLHRIVALHLSRHCNDPRCVRDLYSARAPELAPRLVLSTQGRATPLIAVGSRPVEPSNLFDAVAPSAQ